MKQINTTNPKTIFDYMTTPIISQPADGLRILNVVPNVIPRTDIEIENDLRNATRRNTKCACGKYHPKN